jgi:hypothetical protein
LGRRLNEQNANQPSRPYAASDPELDRRAATKQPQPPSSDAASVPVVYQNWIAHESRRFPVVVVQGPAKPLPALDRFTDIAVGGQRRDQLVGQPLVIPFGVIVDQELG